MINFEALKEGDEAAFETLVAAYAVPIVRYCYGILCNYADAEDAAQIAFIKVYTKRKSLRDAEALSTFIYRTAYRNCIDLIRKRRFLLLPNAEDVMPGSYEETGDEDFPEALRSALKQLSPIDRSLVIGRAVHEMSYTELSNILGKSEQTLRKRYERARAKLAEQLDPPERADANNYPVRT